MDMTDFRPELHVAQQSRKEKLRVQQINASAVHNLEDFSNSWDNSLVHHIPGINPDLIQVRNVRNASSFHDSILIPSGFIGVSPNPSAIPSQTDAILAYQDYTAMFADLSQPIPSSTVIAPIRDISDPQSCGNWKNVVDSSQQVNCDNWTVMNYGGDQAGRVSNVGEVLSNNVNVRNNIFAHVSHCSRPNYNAGQDVAGSSLTNPSSSVISSQEDSQKCHVNSIYRNSLQNLVTVACSGTRNSTEETHHGSWSGNSKGELVLLPSYGNQSVEINVNQWSGESDCDITRKCDQESNKQVLSLSLSSNPVPKVCVSESLIPKPSIIGKSSGKSLHDVVGVSSLNIQRHVGPVGPFTGYATILKSSTFLRPAQELLDEFCISCISKIANKSEASIDVGVTTEEMGRPKPNYDSGALSSTLQSCNGFGGSSSSDSYKPENREKKAKLLFLQEEVCRRYKLYMQQMQMVVSSFESVAGLSTSTPYISLALKRIARNFRCLKNAISDQLKHMSKSLGDEFLSPSISKIEDGNHNTSNTKCIGRHNMNSLQKQKSFGGSVGFPEPQQHVWRPQRGLPERAVAILRAWLFDHFLHPYPTDTDKQMLATQTGLSRNQVSNWFINARVRVWKPMVEEIHTLEIKGLVATEANQNPNRSSIGKFPTYIETSTSRLNNNLDQQEANKNQTMECSGTSSLVAMGSHYNNEFRAENWNIQEKRTRVDYMRNIDASSLMGFVPHNQRNGFERGIGNVSLTLGLRHGVENVQQQQQQQFQGHEDQFGSGQMVHDFVG